MPSTLELIENNPFVIQLSPTLNLSDEQFFAICQNNRQYRLERNAQGDLIIMPPTGSETGNRNAKLTQQLGNWTDSDRRGINFDSSTGFKLPNGADRSPDAAWMTLEKWEAIPPTQRIRFAPVCPDFVVKLRSPTDSLKPLQEKMTEYLANGASLGWLIDRKNRQVYIYRPQHSLECLENPAFVEGEGAIAGFRLDMAKIW
jgi:Uma2 family endonuclease